MRNLQCRATYSSIWTIYRMVANTVFMQGPRRQCYSVASSRAAFGPLPLPSNIRTHLHVKHKIVFCGLYTQAAIIFIFSKMSTTVQVENLGFRQWYLQVSNPHPRIYSWLYATFVPASKLLEDAKEVNMSSPDSSSDIENGSFTVVDDRERAHSSLLCSRCGQTSGKPDRFHYRFFERMKALVRAKKILNKRVGIVLVVLLVLVVLGVG